MKNILLSILLFQVTHLFGQQPFSRKQLKVQQAIVKMFEALSNRDSSALKSYWTSDATLYEYGQVWNLDNLIRRAIAINKSPDFKRANTFEFLSTTQNKNTAWATYRLTSTIFREGKKTNFFWLETVILVRNKNDWMLKHLHSTLLKRD